MTSGLIKRGDIFLVDLEPVRGSEQGKKRPALVIQNNIGNKYSPIVIVAAITRRDHASYPIDVEIKSPEGGIKQDSVVMLNQIRSVDKSRLVEYWGSLSAPTMAQVDEALKISLGLKP